MLTRTETSHEAAMPELPLSAPTVRDIGLFQLAGPWPSKSGGCLSVPFALPYEAAKRFLEGDPTEFARNPQLIRGLRMFIVENMPAGGVGGGEFHRTRSEIIFTTRGKVRWSCEDLYGSSGSLRHRGRSSFKFRPLSFTR